MSRLILGQRSTSSHIAIDGTTLTALKFTRQSPIEMDISHFALNSKSKSINDNYIVFDI